MRKFQIFLSYTNREEEVRRVKPLINEYCRVLMNWAAQNDIEIFYDEFSIEQRQYSNTEMKKLLSTAIKKSDLMTAFLSDGYITSEWCRFEWLKSREDRHPPLHGIIWKPITYDLSRLMLLGSDFLLPEKLTDIKDLKIEMGKDTLEELVKHCVETSKEILRKRYNLPSSR